LDVNYQEDDKTISPPWKFLSSKFISDLCDLGDEKNCLIAVNAICYNKESQKKLLENFRHVKNVQYKAMIETGYNKVILLSRNESPVQFKDGETNIMQLESMLKKWKVPNKLLWIKDLEMENLLHEKSLKEIK